VSEDLPSITIPAAALSLGIELATLAMDAGLAASKSEARRLAQGGGLRVNDRQEADAQRLVTAEDIGEGGVIKLAAGKKKIVLVKIA
ncbi:MAG: S4 domain-containing protein, partial [Pseudomonadota bacterium]|nr:S4 domain-containing protein [Pseudomonadota bacterium]